MFGWGKKDADGRQVRLEHRGKHLRVSRTGGVALRASAKAGGITWTANSSHGVRASTRVAKGTNVFFQNGHFRLRGRYGKGPTKLNLSKSGVTVSTKNSLGTFNWVKPGRSSAKFGGIQVRGRKAVYLHLVLFAVQLVLWLLQAAVFLLVVVFRGGLVLAGLLGQAWRSLADRKRRQALEGLENQLETSAGDGALPRPGPLLGGLAYLLLVEGRGETAAAGDPVADLSRELDRLRAASDEPALTEPVSNLPAADLAEGIALARDLLSRLPARHALVDATVLLGHAYARSGPGPDAVIAAFLALDALCVADGGRTLLEEQQLAALAEAIGLEPVAS